jgi:hypothetical protein
MRPPHSPMKGLTWRRVGGGGLRCQQGPGWVGSGTARIPTTCSRSGPPSSRPSSTRLAGHGGLIPPPPLSLSLPSRVAWWRSSGGVARPLSLRSLRPRAPAGSQTPPPPPPPGRSSRPQSPAPAHCQAHLCPTRRSPLVVPARAWVGSLRHARPAHAQSEMLGGGRGPRPDPRATLRQVG